MVNDQEPGMTDAGTAGMSGNGYAEGAAAMRPEQPRRVDPLHFPLWGSRLIEASAGTGKTYTIAALYLRLVLGHGERVGLAGAGAGLDQPAAPQRKMQRIDSPGLLRPHSSSPLSVSVPGHSGCSGIRHPLPLFIHHGYLLHRIPHGAMLRPS